MKKYINPILTFSSVLMLFYIIYDQKLKIETLKPKNESLIHESDSLKLRCDSIQSELFIQQIDQQRSEYIINKAEEELSAECKQQLEKIMHETE
jgi:hypothetical protein